MCSTAGEAHRRGGADFPSIHARCFDAAHLSTCARKLVASLADAARASSKRKLSTRLRVYCNYPLAAAELGVWSRVMAVLALLVVHGQAFGSSASARCISQAAGLALPRSLYRFQGPREVGLASCLLPLSQSLLPIPFRPATSVRWMPSSHGREVPGRNANICPWRDRKRRAKLRSQSAGQGRVIASCWSRVRVSFAGLTAAPLRASRLANFGAPISSSLPRVHFLLFFRFLFSWIPAFEHDTGASSAVRAAPTTIRWLHFGTSSALQRWQMRATTVRQLAGSLG
jgi:hypothetical protein